MRLRQLAVVGILAVAAALAGGCDDKGLVHPAHQRLEAPPRSISVFRMAGRLGLRVARSGRGHAQLAGPGNTVSIFPQPTAAVYVNGTRLMAPGPIRATGSTIFVPEDIVPVVRSFLRPPPAPTPTRHPRRPKPPPAPVAVVVLDAGHGGRDPGAIACTGMFEKDVTLGVTRRVRRRLERKNVRVVMTRSDDRFVELNDRAEVANRARADLFVSIHADSCDNRRVAGHTLYVARGATGPSVSAAQCVSGRMRRAGVASRGVRRANFRVLVRTTCPAILLELGYLSNPAEARLLARDAYRNALAQTVAEGVMDFLGE